MLHQSFVHLAKIKLKYEMSFLLLPGATVSLNW